jgi:hypothetical protein
MECQVKKNEHFRHHLYELNGRSKAAEAARNMFAVSREDSNAERRAQNCLPASSKEILT